MTSNKQKGPKINYEGLKERYEPQSDKATLNYSCRSSGTKSATDSLSWSMPSGTLTKTRMEGCASMSSEWARQSGHQADPDSAGKGLQVHGLNEDGVIDYTEFCNLCEEKRRNIDPYDGKGSLVTLDENAIFEKKKHLFNPDRFLEKANNNVFEQH
eukprot:CAMPEP_0170550304 /NCGR_PEP_ID=MMETSP0211-20121228/8368_1 /TAXON_ID=311385 /ORGANISM="Pseudokeronopsis sp., Strain OXSARD2" /LENGTH=155 /DNA_ID=CAMNT_0010856779 /DNA_START=813 /DNA_END=1283 /DNA_ORIENTATION=+